MADNWCPNKCGGNSLTICEKTFCAGGDSVLNLVGCEKLSRRKCLAITPRWAHHHAGTYRGAPMMQTRQTSLGAGITVQPGLTDCATQTISSTAKVSSQRLSTQSLWSTRLVFSAYVTTAKSPPATKANVTSCIKHFREYNTEEEVTCLLRSRARNDFLKVYDIPGGDDSRWSSHGALSE
jgi:hypothetical protein